MNDVSLLAGPATAYRSSPTVSGRFLDWVAATPSAPALQAGARTLTYEQLLDRAARLATRVADAAPDGGPLAVDTNRPGEAVVGLLAAHLLARPYVCVGGKQPPARLRRMLEAAGATALVHASPEGRALAGEAGLPAVDGAGGGGEPFAARPADPAGADAMYVLFTSGSTGEPKGVVVEEPSVRNLLAWATDRFGARPGWRFSQLADLSFDAHVLDVWFALVTGGTVVVPDERPLGAPTGLRSWLAAERIDFGFVPTSLMPSLLAAWGHDGHEPAYLWAGGEQLMARPGPGVGTAIVNGYGPTEATVIVTAEEVEPGDVATLGLPGLGAPVANVHLAVVDPDTLAVRPRGEPGELLVGGAALARGYLEGGPGERFVEAAPAGGDQRRWYRTGDLVSVDAAGRLAFHGRIDRQVQVRGYRVEPAEVEAALLAHPLVAEATVQPVDDGPSRSLVAYVVGAGGDTTTAALVRALRRDLAEALPDYMVPAYVEVLDDLPRTPGGKVDAQRLAPRGSSRLGVATGYEAPATDLERYLCEVWEDALDLHPVGVSDDFFELGGHSLVAIRIAERVAAERSLQLDVATFFSYPSVRELSRALTAPPAPAA